MRFGVCQFIAWDTSLLKLLLIKCLSITDLFFWYYVFRKHFLKPISMLNSKNILKLDLFQTTATTTKINRSWKIATLKMKCQLETFMQNYLILKNLDKIFDKFYFFKLISSKRGIQTDVWLQFNETLKKTILIEKKKKLLLAVFFSYYPF